MEQGELQNSTSSHGCSSPTPRQSSCCETHSMRTVQEEGPGPQNTPNDTNSQGPDTFDKYESRRNRGHQRSRRVPNLLSGPPLIPGPVTPNFVPACSPEYCGLMNAEPQVAIFPQFMLTPSISEPADDHDEERTAFVIQAMQKAIGLPPIVFDPCVLQQWQPTRARKGRRERNKVDPPANKLRGGSRETKSRSFEATEFEFPSLKVEQGCVYKEVATPSPLPMKRVKFPSKSSQLKKQLSQTSQF